MQKIEVGRLGEWLGHEFLFDWVLLDQERISEFARVTDDHNWVHVDLERAKALRGGLLTSAFAFEREGEDKPACVGESQGMFVPISAPSIERVVTPS